MSTQSPPQRDHTVLWWIGWITLTIVSFFVSSTVWTPVIAGHFGDMSKPGVPMIWVACVFGTWMLLLVPLIIMMYNKVDKAYDDARLRREEQAKRALSTRFPVPVLEVDRNKRLLPKPLRSKLKRLPKTLQQGQLVRIGLADGRSIENAFVWQAEEIIGVYGRSDFPFDAAQAVTADLVDAGEAVPTDYLKWLRLEDPAS